MSSGSVRVVITDSSVLINFLVLDRLDLLENLAGYSFCLSEHVVAEITHPEQSTRIQKSIQEGRLTVVQMTDPVEMALFSSFLATLGKGEAASLALAKSRSWFIACDEKRSFLTRATASLGASRILNTVSLLVLAIRQGLLSVEEADVIKADLEGRRFHIKVKSFADLLPKEKEG